MKHYSTILKNFSKEIINSIQNREYLGDLDYEVEDYFEFDRHSFLLTLIFRASIDDITIVTEDKGPNNELLKIQCKYNDPYSAIRMSLYYNDENRTLDVSGTNLLLSNNSSHEVKLANYIDDENYESLNQYVEEELDTYSNLDFKRLFEEIGPIYVRHNIFEK